MRQNQFLFANSFVNKITEHNNAKFPQHPYGTRANRRRMKDLGATVESVKNDVNQLKDQMGQILEALVALKNPRDNSATRNDEATSSNPTILQIGALQTNNAQGNSAWPPYGLPPNYTPPYENVHGVVTPNIKFDPSNVLVSQQEPIQVQPSDGPINVSAGAAVYTGRPSIVQAALGEGAPIGSAVQRSPQDVEESKTKLKFLEERLKAIEGGGSFEFRDIAGLCLVSNLVIPPKFKVPEFEKYKGTSCPRNHLTMYCRKMAVHVGDEKLLIHFF